jgi:ABC-type antimicrobial peptide transport system permease subunit
MKSILTRTGVILGVSFASAFVSSTGIATVVGFWLYNVVAGHGHVLEIATMKFGMAAVIAAPIGMIGGITSGVVGWKTASDVSQVNKRIAVWSAAGAVLVGLLTAILVGINTIT